MNDNDNDNIEHTHKELLYNLFYELSSEIKGCKIEIDEEQYQESIKNIQFKQIVKYIRESIQILLKKKNQVIVDLTTHLNRKDDNNNNITNDELYIPLHIEMILKQHEAKERMYLKQILQYRLQREALETKIEEFMDMEDEFEEMKTKFKYENGKFLSNDRKDNEIFILRAENSKLKSTITQYEQQIKSLQTTIKSKDNEIHSIQSKLNDKTRECNNLLLSNNNNTSIENTSRGCKGSNGILFNSNFNNECSPKCINTFKKLPTRLISKTNTNSTNNNTLFNQTSSEMINGNNKFIHVDSKGSFSDRNKRDFMSKYFSNKQHHKQNLIKSSSTQSLSLSQSNIKNKEQLNQTAIANIKITRLPIGQLNRNNNIIYKNVMPPPINKSQIGIANTIHYNKSNIGNKKIKKTGSDSNLHKRSHSYRNKIEGAVF